MKNIKVILLIVSLFWMNGLYAKHHLYNYTVSIRTKTSYYEKYKVVGLTDSSITIYKQGREGVESIMNPLTLFVKEIETITTIHKGEHLAYVLPIIALSTAGLIAGIRERNNANHNPNVTGFAPDLSGLAVIGGIAVGFLFGSFVGVFIDALAFHRLYSIDMKPTRFLSFKNKFTVDDSSD